MLNNLHKHLPLKRNIYIPRSELDNLRFNLLKEQLLYAYQNIPYYKSAFKEAGVDPSNLKTIEELSDYPLINKDLIKKNSSKFLNKKSFIKDRLKSHTSGSTGQPMWTYYDMMCWIRKKYLVKARARMECGLKPFEKITVFDTASQNSKDKTNFFFRTFKSHYKILSVFESNEKIVQELRIFSPAALYGAPSYFFQLAQFISLNRIQLPSIKKVFTSSEYLQDTVREYIKRIFNAEVYDIYGSTEFKEVAWECEKHEGYHINEDEVIVEIVKDGEPASPGIIGNIVITDLRNTAMPLIRYQIFDKGILLNEKCSCGRTFSMMKPFAGRLSEYIILPDGEFLSPYIFTTSIEKIEGLQQYQIVQLKEKKILVKVITDAGNFEKIALSIKNILCRITNYKMEIEVEQQIKIDVEENGKFKVVKNLVLD